MSIRKSKATRASVAVAILLASGVARAATGGAPLTMAHSGYLLDGADAPLSSASLSMKFRIFDQPSAGNLQWEGTCATVQVARGYYTVLLGSTACPGTAGGGDSILDTSDLPPTGARWLEVEVGDVTMSPRIATATVPTAAVASRALDADALDGFVVSDFATAIHGHLMSEVTGLQAALDGKLSAESDPKVGTLAAGKWCTSDGAQIACTSAEPSSASGGQPNAGVAAASCSPATAGYLWYDAAASALKLCNGASYVTVNTVSAPPGAPGAPTVTPSNGSLAVSWSAVAGASSYEVGYQAGSVIDGAATVVAVASGTSTTLSGLTNGTTYAVAVRSMAGTYSSAWSAVTAGTPIALTCSAGYIPVPQTTLPDGTVVAPFCVMQFEAKNVSGAVSQTSGAPWVSVTWTAASAACSSAGKHLITENEWLALANNAANVGSNWTNGSVGSGALYSGHNDSAPNNALSVLNVNDGYDQTGNSAGSNQRRTLTLSNGQVVWDLAGNVWEWTDATLPIASRYHGGTSGWMTYNVTESSLTVAANVPAAKRPPSPWNATQGMGRYYDGASAAGAYNSVSELPDNCTGYCASQAAFLRGGGWAGATDAGVFSLVLHDGRAHSYPSFGFRCAGP